MIVAAVVASGIVGSSGKVLFAQREVRLFTVDAVLCIGFVALALRRERFWTLWAAALLALSIELQLAIWIAPVGNLRNVYLLMHALNAYPLLALLAVATARHHRRKFAISR